MKNAILLISLICSSIVFSQTSLDYYAGLKSGLYTLEETNHSTWLDDKINALAADHDFNEDVSYIGEEWDKVETYCDLSEEDSETLYSGEVITGIDVHKLVNKKGRTASYVVTVIASLAESGVKCNFPRTVYLLNRRGKAIDMSLVYDKYGFSFSSVLEAFYVENDVVEFYF